MKNHFKILCFCETTALKSLEKFASFTGINTSCFQLSLFLPFLQHLSRNGAKAGAFLQNAINAIKAPLSVSNVLNLNLKRNTWSLYAKIENLALKAVSDQGDS